MVESPTQLFSNRVDDYVRYRPNYPESVVQTLIDKCALDEKASIADIGSGTGIFARQLLDKHLRVTAVEPNDGMRHAAEQMLSKYESFTSINGSAEQSTLANSCIDLIVSAQAFHWFSGDKATKEFKRILKPNGWLALIWNKRQTKQHFQHDYDNLLLEHAPQYRLATHTNLDDKIIAKNFDPKYYQTFNFEHFQVLDEDSFLGRMQSASYTPAPQSPKYEPIIAAAKRLFAKYEHNGRISFEYDTHLYLGKLPR